MIIGIDHGYGYIKTAHCVFPAGIVAYEHEPHSLQQVLEYGGRYYVCGTGRQPVKRNKTEDDSYKLLTLAAIAEELRARDAPSVLSIQLATGLPLTRVGREKQAFKEYLLSFPRPVRFRYEEKPYEIAISDVSVYPQGYAAIIPRIRQYMSLGSVIVVDVGSWTVDAMRLDFGRANAETCRSLEMGVIRCMNEVLEQVRRRLGLSLTEPQIEQVIHGRDAGVSDEVLAIVREQLTRYAQALLSALIESSFDIRAVPSVFLGGGAFIIQNHNPNPVLLGNAEFLDDIHINAKGYELICEQVMQNAKR